MDVSRSRYYRGRGDFRKRPPQAGKGWKRRSPIFVIQKHDARRLHYDFRLEIDGVLKSWAVPKGPSTDPRDKRLAVLVDDHELEHADFEGIIPESEYGSGAVIVWDAGPYRNLNQDGEGREIPMREAFDSGRIEVWLEGKKIRGGYALIRSRLGGREENWLLIKMRDEAADARRVPTRTEPESVLSGRTIEEVQKTKSSSE
ncbi:MAG: DNA ligase [Gammaproteobacteria bacterium]|nr:DNA ligase [Gammaproteobacteria bacterium]NIR84510.1 DNA ligase [Gammaproteobacteria bacterium]NIR90413.1 DNA ligase [Gammaproteobacteria bacterium]NIU05561.1 DNA ligase [Gammaproteobacteria bacterium]NIV52700.1 DNA ligase [Gammaproteobacteria bacterium]